MARRPSVQLEGRTVLVTGAARGLGRELALRLARNEGAELILVDRDAEGLERLAAELHGGGPARVRLLARDLLSAGGGREIFGQLAEGCVSGLSTTAGLTHYGRAAAAELPKLRAIIDLDFRVTLELSLLFHSRFRAQGAGFILNVTSLGAFLPLPYQAVYAAAKAAAQSFTDSLRAENRGSPVRIATFAPSGLDTDMVAEAGLTRHKEQHRKWYVAPEQAARAALDGLKKGRTVIVPGLANRLVYALVQVVPRSILLAAAAGIYRYERYRAADAVGP